MLGFDVVSFICLPLTQKLRRVRQKYPGHPKGSVTVPRKKLSSGPVWSRATPDSGDTPTDGKDQ